MAGLICMMLAISPGCGGGSGEAINRDIITRQIQDHHYYWDSRDLETWGKLFTAEATTNSFVNGNPEPVWSSPDLETLLVASRRYLDQLEGVQTRHHPSAIQFLELTDATATTRHTVLVTKQVQDKQQPELSASGTYTIHWVKTSNSWLIQQRDFHKD